MFTDWDSPAYDPNVRRLTLEERFLNWLIARLERRCHRIGTLAWDRHAARGR